MYSGKCIFPHLLKLNLGENYVQKTQKVIHFSLTGPKTLCKREDTLLSWRRNKTVNLYSRSTIDKMFDWLTDLPRRQNNSAMERFIGKVNNSSELEEKMRQWDRLQRKNGIAYF